MAKSLSKLLLHIVFSTKRRANLIPKTLLPELHAVIASICRKQGSEAFRVGGTENHVHIAGSLPRTVSVSELIKTIKLNSSKWINADRRLHFHFYWQAGYGVFTIGYSQLNSLLTYIENQERHHSIKSYEAELLCLLRNYNVVYDEEYLWD